MPVSTYVISMKSVRELVSDFECALPFGSLDLPHTTATAASIVIVNYKSNIFASCLLGFLSRRPSLGSPADHQQDEVNRECAGFSQCDVKIDRLQFYHLLWAPTTPCDR